MRLSLVDHVVRLIGVPLFGSVIQYRDTLVHLQFFQCAQGFNNKRNRVKTKCERTSSRYIITKKTLASSFNVQPPFQNCATEETNQLNPNSQISNICQRRKSKREREILSSSALLVVQLTPGPLSHFTRHPFRFLASVMTPFDRCCKVM